MKNKNRKFRQPDPDSVVLFFDGACEPINPGGTIGFGALIKKGSEVIHSISGKIDESRFNSNNVAEYIALNKGLEWLFDNGHRASVIEVYGDSKLVINQMSGTWGAKGGLYYWHYREALDMLPFFLSIRFFWIPRHLNKEADELSKTHLVDIPKRDWQSEGENRFSHRFKSDPRYD